jgi:hypothetical protein
MNIYFYDNEAIVFYNYVGKGFLKCYKQKHACAHTPTETEKKKQMNCASRQKKMLASEALHVVLHHSMLPNLGWDSKVCEHHIYKLNEEISAHQTNVFQDTADTLSIEISSEQDTISNYDWMKSDNIEANSSKFLKVLLDTMSRENPKLLCGRLHSQVSFTYCHSYEIKTYSCLTSIV